MANAKAARPLRTLGTAAVVALAAAAWTVHAHQRDARLLRMNTDGPFVSASEMRHAVSEGRGVFEQRCAACHRPGRGPDLGDRDWLYGQGSLGEIEQTVAYGVRSGHPKGWNLADMPAFAAPTPSKTYPVPQLSPDEIRDLIAFLRQKRGDAAAPDAAARGALLFAGKGVCYDCHGNDALGNPAIGAPNLIDRIWLYGKGDDASLFETIANGRRGVMPAFSGRLPPVHLRQVAIYVYSLSHPEAAPKEAR